MAASGQSLMPEGLEKDLTPRDLADLIAFLETAGPHAQESSESIHAQADRRPTRRGRRSTSCRSRPGCR